MKKMIKLFVAFVIVMNATVFANADALEREGILLKVIHTSNDIYNIIYQGAQQQQVSIEFIDKNDKVLYYESVNTSEGFVKSLDLSDLPAGTYSVKLTSATETVSEEIRILTAEEMYGKYVSVKAIGEELFLLSLDEQIGKSLELFIRDSKGEILYQGKMDSSNQKVYDLKNLVGTEASFLIYDGQEIVKEQQVEI